MAEDVDRPERFAGLQEGALVLADISGYSAFIAKTEVDHSWSIMHELLDTMVRSLHGRMDVSQVEGDAILFISGLSSEEVIASVEQTFVAFHRRLRDMQAVTTCPCAACANIGVLRLKFVVHYGSFSRQRLGSVEQLHGTDVIVAHRLLKNKVPSKEYLLVTDAVLERLPDALRKGFVPHQEEFDLGVISGGYREIASLWTEAEAAERKRVEAEEAVFTSDITVDAPIKIVYQHLMKPDVMQRYLFSDAVETIPGARGEVLSSEFHCHHGGEVITIRVVSVDPERELTVIADKPTTLYITTTLTEAGADRTRMVRAFLWEEPADPEIAENVRQGMQGMAVAGESEMQAVFAEKAEAYRQGTG
jgi:uncharacterized protein YndB with AHSA1/START domain